MRLIKIKELVPVYLPNNIDNDLYFKVKNNIYWALHRDMAHIMDYNYDADYIFKLYMQDIE